MSPSSSPPPPLALVDYIYLQLAQGFLDKLPQRPVSLDNNNNDDDVGGDSAPDFYIDGPFDGYCSGCNVGRYRRRV